MTTDSKVTQIMTRENLSRTFSSRDSVAQPQRGCVRNFRRSQPRCGCRL